MRLLNALLLVFTWPWALRSARHSLHELRLLFSEVNASLGEERKQIEHLKKHLAEVEGRFHNAAQTAHVYACLIHSLSRRQRIEVLESSLNVRATPQIRLMRAGDPRKGFRIIVNCSIPEPAPSTEPAPAPEA